MSGFFDMQEQLAAQAKPDLPPPATPPQSVSDLTRAIKQSIKSAFPYSVFVRGEISNYRGQNQSGHHYFRLKDPEAVIESVVFAGNAKNLKFKLADGLEVIAKGRLDLFEAGGKYNLIITSLEPVGAGALELAFRQLKNKLELEGLFSPDRKKPIPPYPRTIALITSRNAAGLQDQLKVLRRFPFLRLIIVPIPVQGEGAAPRIASALDWLSANHATIGGVDLALLGRGGGSFEDLFEFSREEVARAVARSAIPLVTGIGHEVDTSIADLVADHHAHTPTEAATYAIRMWRAAEDFVSASTAKLQRETRTNLTTAQRRLLTASKNPFLAKGPEFLEPRHQRVDDREHRLSRAQHDKLLALRRKLDTLQQRLAKHDPRRVLIERRERLSKSRERLLTAMSARIRRHEQSITTANTKLAAKSPTQRIQLATHKLATQQTRLRQALTATLKTRAAALDASAAQLRVLGPDSVLSRGFSLTLDKTTGKPITAADQVQKGDQITTRLSTGEFDSQVL